MVINEEKTEITLYKAYGYAVKGTKGTYRWTYDGSGREEECITKIVFLAPDGTELLSRYMGNNIIFMSCFNSHIDNILWHLAHEVVTENALDRLLYDVLVRNTCLFSYLIEQRKRKVKIA